VIVVVGGGWAGCAAAYAASATGFPVTLVEKTDMLLGTGLVGGIMRNNGRFTATEEICALGGDEFFALIESVARHRNIDFPGHRHATLYDVSRIETVIRNALLAKGIKLRMQTRVTGVIKKDDRTLTAVRIAGSTALHIGEKDTIEGSAFVDATGTAGPRKYCYRYGSGCAMCILRCPTFGPRMSITAAAGIREMQAGEGLPHFEAMSGSCKLDKKSLSPELVNKLERDGVLVISLDPALQKRDALTRKVCQQYAIDDYASNLVILDTGQAKLMTSFYPLEKLRTIKGFENVRYADPYSGGRGNSVRFMAIAPCWDSLRVKGMDNLFCAGEKTGLLVGHTEAIATGFLAGHNAARFIAGVEPLVLPETLAVGDIVAYMHREMQKKEGMEKKYTFSGSVYFERMKELDLYTTDVKEIYARVAGAGLRNVFKTKLV